MQSEEFITSAEDIKRPSIFRSTAIMSVATTFSRLTGYLRVFALAFALGGTVIADTYNTANIMPNILFELVMGGVLASAVIPVYVDYLTNASKKETDYIVSNSLNIMFAFGVGLSLLGVIFAEYFVKAITYLEPARATPTMVFFFRIFALQIMFYALTSIFVSILNSNRKFMMPMAAPIFNNLTVVFTVFGLYLPISRNNPDLALLVLAIGTTAGVAMMAIVQIPSVLRTGFKYRPVFNLKDKAIKRIISLGLPMIGFAIAVQISTWVIYSLAQKIKMGPTAYQYSLMFFQLPYAIFAVSVITAIFPELSEQYSRNDLKKFKRTLSLGLRATSFIVIPASATLLVLSHPIISLALQYGKFGPEAVNITAQTLRFFALGLLSYSLYNMLTRVYYSLQDTKTPMKISMLCVPVQVALNFSFIGVLGVRGLALGYALTLTFAVVAQLYFLRKKIGPLGISHMLRSFGKQTVAVIPAAVVMYFVYHITNGLAMPHLVSQFANVLTPVGIGSVLYIGLALLLGVEEVDFIRRLSRKVFSRG
ncbi:MAG: murein biosynthesis integral membrane protein MurJ [Actinomycetota bacterium]|nr:murein biosynthesis integral membrane protein MurJ [Actinomycetota bacterium]